MSHASSSHRVRRRAPIVVTAALALAGVIAVPAAVSDPGGNGNGNANGRANNPNALQFDLLASAGKSNSDRGASTNNGANKNQGPNHGDCKNDNRGNHYGYNCDPEEPGGNTDPVITSDPIVNNTTVNNTTINQAASTAAPAAAQVSAQSIRKACLSRRSFRIRIRTRKADPVVRATVTVNGRTVQTIRGRRVTAPVKLTGLPKGRTIVRIIAKTKSGKTLRGKRTYHPCTAKRKKTIPDL